MPFVNLHSHTHFSILQALPSPKELFVGAKELDQSAISITDYGSLANVWDSLKASRETNVKLITGCEFYFVNDVENKDAKLRYVVLLAKNAIGYKNLLLLNRDGFDHGSIILKRVFPIIDWKLLEKHSEGLLCLTGCGNGIVGQLLNYKDFAGAEDTLKRLLDIFGSDLGAEVQAHNLVRNPVQYLDKTDQPFTNHHIIRLAQKLNVKIIPTSNVHYLKKEDAETHDVMLAIGSMQPVYSNGRIRFPSHELYLKSYDEMKAFFARNNSEKFAEEICANTLEFADKCEVPEWIDPKFSNPTGKELPTYPVKDENDFPDFQNWLNIQSDDIKSLDEDKNYLRYKCEFVFEKMVPKGKEKEYRARLEEELDVLYYCGVASYMLVVADYIRFYRETGATPSPGRGSDGGSLVAYFLGIHMADPIKFGLVFERFHNKLKKACSDIDSDVAKNKRQEVIQYIINKYGLSNFAQIANINTLTPKVYARDMARSCDFANDRVKSVAIGTNIADVIPSKIDGVDIRSYDKTIQVSPLFAEYTQKYTQLEKHSVICGKPRSAGLHAAGIVIGSRPIASVVPVRIDKNGVLATELDKDRVEEAGLVKMDILGIETLDIIDETNKIIKSRGKEVPVIDYNTFDKKAYDLIGAGNTYGVFQFGISGGTIDLCKKIRPQNMEDLALITALARPNAKNIRESFVKTRKGEVLPKYIHPSLRRALAPTFGFSLFDESLLVLAKDVAGWDLAEADKLRKLTKEKGKNPKKALQWRGEFIDGAVKNDVPRDTAIKIWEEIVEPFGSYGFNKSHAVLYSMLSFHTAYLKAHFPLEFMLANLMFEIRSATKDAPKNIEKIKQELRNSGAKINPPDLNKSEMTYSIQPDGSLLTGLDALKFVGDDAIRDILAARPFTSFDEFMIKTSSSKVRSNTIQALASCGCFDSFGISRKLIFLYCSDYKKKLQVWLKKHDSKTETFEYPWPVEGEWDKPELFALEKNYLGEAFICGKKEAYGDFFNDNKITFDKVKALPEKEFLPSIKGEVKSIFEFKVKKMKSKFFGQEMIKAIIEDVNNEQIGLTIFPRQLEEVKSRLKQYSSRYKFEPGIVIHIAGSMNIYDGEVGIILNTLYDMKPHPAKPQNIKAKSVSIKKEKAGKVAENKGTVEDLEDYLFNNGLIDLNEDEEENGESADI